MPLIRRLITKTAGAVTALAMTAAGALASDTVRVGLGDIDSVMCLNLLIAMERAKERGLDMEMTFFNSEDGAVQAVLPGEAHIGVGAPYFLMANSEAPSVEYYAGARA